MLGALASENISQDAVSSRLLGAQPVERGGLDGPGVVGVELAKRERVHVFLTARETLS